MDIEDTFEADFEFSYVEGENGREGMRVSMSVDASDMCIGDVLERVEQFLISSGYDFIKRGTLRLDNHHGKTFSSEDVGWFSGERNVFPEDVEGVTSLKKVSQEQNILKSVLEELKRKDNIEIAERMSGIDRTAKVVDLGNYQEKKEGEDILFTVSTEYEHISPGGETPNWSDYDVSVTIEDISMDFSKHELEVDKDDNIIETEKD